MLFVTIFEPTEEEEVFLGPARGPQALYTCHCGTTEIYDYSAVAVKSPFNRNFFCRDCGMMVPQIKLIAPGEKRAWYRTGLHGVKIRR